MVIYFKYPYLSVLYMKKHRPIKTNYESNNTSYKTTYIVIKQIRLRTHHNVTHLRGK